MDFLLTSDWHLRDDRPSGRSDDFWKAQWTKLEYLIEFSYIHNLVILHAGDLFHRWWVNKNRSHRLLAKTLEVLKNSRIFLAPGQHDLPGHNIDNLEDSGISVLSQLGIVSLCSDMAAVELVRYNCVPQNNRSEILVWHRLTCQAVDWLWPGSNAATVQGLVSKFPETSLFVTGDNHRQFHEKHNDAWVVNPGSLMRMTKDQEEHVPAFFVWSGSIRGGSLERVPLPRGDNVFCSEEHDFRRFSTALSSDTVGVVSPGSVISFEENMKRSLQEKPVDKNVETLIWESIDGHK